MLKKLVAAVVFLAIVGFATSQLSPWPSALFYRYFFDKNGVAMNEALARHAPASVTTRADISYGAEPLEKLDIYLPAGVDGSARALPTILWIHGGGFLSGDKSQISNYLKIIAAAGYVVVGINYTLAPAAQHPTPTRQANAALAFLRADAGKLNIDPDRMFLAGDSAGSQIAAQLGIAITEPAFARSIGLVPAIPPVALRGLVLHCGIYDPANFKFDGKMGSYLKTLVWSYFGSKDLRVPAMPEQFSIVRNITRTMPPLFVTAGNADPALVHSKALVEAAGKVGVSVDTLFFPQDYTPPLQHEYQFDLDTAAGQLALQRSLAFIAERSQL
ncbi:lipase [Labrys miyagiensis]|uniref:Lipase n=1 Tax=Labrys miyagiensis TaxID=346912 RepID=A0ABQ6CPF5_9HYPH|nr:alpha/beta hydrolase [Labrys miyagiensis]GLS22203.1 lipase [Labrys miyagiensis]